MTSSGAEPAALARVRRHLEAGGRAWRFLDYDGTLVPIAPAPDEARPDAALLALLSGLGADPRLRVAVLSGRSLASLQAMLAVPGLVLAGTYGLEVQIAGIREEAQAGTAALRPVIVRVIQAWAGLVGERAGFLVEDKGLAVALHARWAAPADAGWVLPRARALLETVAAAAPVRILGGERFLELAPAMAHKGQAVEWLARRLPWPRAEMAYFGDDDKDEEAYAVVRRLGGVPIAVGPRQHRVGALGWLPSPDAVRRWLASLLARSK